jgi:DNA polymerase III subunit delta'
MTDASKALPILSGKLCPWVRPVLEQLEHAKTSARLGHGWLLVGPQGVGKLNLALVFAGRLLAAASREVADLSPAEAVAAMRARHQPDDHHPDLHWIFPEEDKRTIAVEQIRDVSQALSLKSHGGLAKVVIIEPAEAMTTAAANALLKTLEEPLGDTYLLLVSHQPGRLPATIRSRCQRINVAAPSVPDIAAWLGASAADVAALQLLAGRAPLAIAALTSEEIFINNKKLIDTLDNISMDKVDAQAVADQWLKLDVEAILSWLGRALHAAIRDRFGAEASTPVTDPTGAALHNLWRHLTLRALFEQYRRTETLLSQLGSGVNVELALKALLIGFQANRGHP